MSGAQRGAFWAAVAGVAILADFALELVAAKLPQTGLAKFAAFAHRGAA